MIAGRFDRVLLLFDGDDAGRAATDDCLVRLGRHLWARALALPGGQQPDDLAPDALRELVASAR